MADKRYHSGAALERKRNWGGKIGQQQGNYGKRILGPRGEFIEPGFAHCYDTGGMQLTHVRKHENILRRQQIHFGAFNPGLNSASCWALANCESGSSAVERRIFYV